MYCLDLKTGKIVWHSDYLTSNDIIVLGDGYVVCSYGFTDEKDFVFLLDKKTGDVLSRMPLDKKAEYIEIKDGCLYVVDSVHNVYVFRIES